MKPYIILISFLLIANLSQAAKISLGQVNFNETDVTTVIQNAFNSNVDSVTIQNTGKPWIVQPLFIKRDNLVVVLEAGVVIQAKSGAFAEGMQLLKISDRHLHRVKNITIVGYGATFQMIKSEYNTNENRHCLQIEWSENINIYGLTLKDSGGDGILIQRSYYGDPCLNVHIKDCIADNNRRQGISVISAENLLIENCEFKNTHGTAPMAGIDIEPDPKTADLTKQVLKNIVVKNCRFTNNGKDLYSGHGIALALHQPGALLEPVSIRFENCFVTGIRGISIYTSSDVKGFVEFQQCLIENTSEVGIALHNAAYAGSSSNKAFVSFKECVFRNMATSYDKPIQIEGRKWSDPSTDILEYGGVDFIDCALQDTKNREFILAIDGPASSLGLANVKGNITVINPNGGRTNLGTKAHDINLKITEIKTGVNVSATIIASDPDAWESAADEGRFNVSRITNYPTIPYAIEYNLSGTATSQRDYGLMNAFVIIPPNQEAADVIVSPIKDDLVENLETVIATIIEDVRPATTKASYKIGISSTQTVNIYDIDRGVPLSAYDRDKLNGESSTVSMSPNPANEYIVVDLSSFEEDSPVQIELSDNNGKPIIVEKVQPNANTKFTLMVSQLPEGMFFLTVRDGKKLKTGKLVIYK
ncbi:MAG TPA: right-handed parallel beta-helix repeat-containing protein [Cytophagaceae bacterium]|jgi:hypothetical protein